MSDQVLTRARLLVDAGRHQQAIELLTNHLAAEPHDGRLWRLISVSHRALGHGYASLKAAEQAISLDPDDDEAHGLAGLALLESLNAPHAAVPAFDEALRLNPASHHLHNRALALHRSKRDKAALVDIDRALAINPLSAGSHVLRGAILSGLRHSRASRKATRRALELDPGGALGHNNQGVDLLRQGRIAVAAAAFDRALAADPHDHLVQSNIEVVLLKLARRLFLMGLAASGLAWLAASAGSGDAVRHLVGPVVLLLLLALALLPLRRLSSGARLYLLRQVRNDSFLLYACAVAALSSLFALVLLEISNAQAVRAGGALRLFIPLNIGYVLWSRQWAAEHRNRGR